MNAYAAPIAHWTLTVLSILIGLMSLRFLFLGLEEAFPGSPFDAFLQDDRAVFAAHVAASPIALAIGGIQFFRGLRAKVPGMHRWMGRVYAVAVLIGGASGLLLSLTMIDRPAAGVGFFLLAVVWIGTTVQAVRFAWMRDFAEHRKWMIRSFALTASAVTLRLYLLGFMGAGWDYEQASPYLAWICWVPNLVIAEWMIRRGSRNNPLAATA